VTREVEREQLTVAANGRRLEVELSGPENGPALIFHNGTPSAGTMYDRQLAEGAARGMRHVAYSRPGYGSSDRYAGRTVRDCVSDARAVADELRIERFFVAGASGGGPHTLACAALLPERVIAAAAIASAAPRDAAGLDWMAGMGQENLDEFAAADDGEDQLLAFLEPRVAELLRAPGTELEAAFGDLLSQVDRDVLTGEFADFMAASTHAALAHGPWGWFDDDLAFVHDWGFDLSEIERPVTIWHGQQDRFVPFSHGQWLVEHVSGARARLFPGHGHLSLTVGAYGDVLDDLLEHAD
jgi:pimeloyl-ACP methyl ester carboxylesterase